MKRIWNKDRYFDYDEENLDVQDLSPIVKEDCVKTLFTMQDLLKEKGIDLYLAYGTLLGAVRDKDFIEGDLDVDCCITNWDAVFDNLQYLSDHGMKLIRANESLFTFRNLNGPGCYIDLYYMRIPHNLWALYCYQHGVNMCPRKYLQDGEILFLGRYFKCPQNPEHYLRFLYGKTWNIPIGKQEKKYKYTVTSHYYYKIIKQRVKYFVQEAIGWYHWRHLVKKQYRINDNQ